MSTTAVDTPDAPGPHGFTELGKALEQLEQDNARMRALLGEQLMRLEQAAGIEAPLPAEHGEHAEEPPQPHHHGHAATDDEHDRPHADAPGITYRLTTPMMKTRQLRDFQRLLNGVYRRWKIDFKIEVDGEYGAKTRRAAKRAAYALGIDGAGLEHGLTPDIRRKIRHPEQRTPQEKARARKRREWRQRLRKRYEGGGPAAALDFARKHVETTESPPQSNRGPLIDRWNRAAGIPPGPNAWWCGAFCNACLVAAGFQPMRFMAYCPAIEQHAKSGADGWSWQGPGSTPKPGDLVLYLDRRKGVAGHVGLVEHMDGGMLVTYEGNTSRQGSTSSQSNGGGVFHRRRNPRGSAYDPPVRGYARPPYRG
jgi:hypothetical protein